MWEWPSVVLSLIVYAMARPAPAADDELSSLNTWNVGTPIATYWAGPPMTDQVARQMTEGGVG